MSVLPAEFWEQRSEAKVEEMRQTVTPLRWSMMGIPAQLPLAGAPLAEGDGGMEGVTAVPEIATVTTFELVVPPGPVHATR